MKTTNTIIDSDLQIYVACLASYNEGILHGAWIDATLGEDEIREEIAKILKSSSVPFAEEYAIHDYELSGVKIGEYESIEKVCDIASALSECHNPELLALLYNENCLELDEAIDMLENCYIGKFDSLEEFGIHDIENQWIEIPDSIKYHIDYESYGKELAYDYSVYELDNSLHFFYNY